MNLIYNKSNLEDYIFQKVNYVVSCCLSSTSGYGSVYLFQLDQQTNVIRYGYMKCLTTRFGNTFCITKNGTTYGYRHYLFFIHRIEACQNVSIDELENRGLPVNQITLAILVLLKWQQVCTSYYYKYVSDLVHLK